MQKLRISKIKSRMSKNSTVFNFLQISQLIRILLQSFFLELSADEDFVKVYSIKVYSGICDLSMNSTPAVHGKSHTLFLQNEDCTNTVLSTNRLQHIPYLIISFLFRAPGSAPISCSTCFLPVLRLGPNPLRSNCFIGGRLRKSFNPL